MSTSQNGWSVIPTSSGTRNWIIPGTHRTVRLEPGHAGFVLVVLALWFNDVIEKIGVGTWDDWGWSVRDVRGTTATVSNHSSGTAIDLNATLHPWTRPVSATFRAWQVVRIHAHLVWMGGVVRWGGDYQHSPIDGMHFEINTGHPRVRRLAKRLAKTKRGRRVISMNHGYRPVVTWRPGMRDLRVGDRGPDVRFVQRKVGAKQDGVFGPKTQEKVKAFERAQKHSKYPHMKADGVVGPITWRALGVKVKY